MWRTVAVVGLYDLGEAKRASSCWEVYPKPLSSYLPRVYRPFPIRCDLRDSHKGGGPGAACSKQDARLEFQPWYGHKTAVHIEVGGGKRHLV